MVQPIVEDPIFLSQKSVPASKEDLPVTQDLVDTSSAHSDHCVGVAANMIGTAKQIIQHEIDHFNGVLI